MTKDSLIQKYKQYRKAHHDIPSFKEFCRYAGTHRREVEMHFGSEAYSKLQIECGDNPSKLNLVRTSREIIMRQYGDLAAETLKSLGRLPVQADWIYKQLRPTISGLDKSPHGIKWSELHLKFKDWAEAKGIEKYSEVLTLINKAKPKALMQIRHADLEFKQFVDAVRLWSPARGRNHEETYKVELRAHISSLGYAIAEEKGDSHFDLMIDKKFGIEIKKALNTQSEYDRLFGQLVRHLEYLPRVIALLLDVPRGEDNFNEFSKLVDKYLNKDEKVVEIIRK